jgi:hypothetical protein
MFPSKRIPLAITVVAGFRATADGDSPLSTAVFTAGGVASMIFSF